MYVNLVCKPVKQGNQNPPKNVHIYIVHYFKVEEVRAWKDELMKQKKDMIEKKMQQAEEKRQTMLKSKAQKAHDEEAKVGNIYLKSYNPGKLYSSYGRDK